MNEQEQRYEDYKRGWLLGASNRPRLALLETPCPTYMSEFDRGEEDGHRAFTDAMQHRYRSLNALKETL